MSEHHDRKTGDFAKYDAMESDALEEILRLDSQAPEGEKTDTEELLYIMGVLADRKRNSVNPGKTAQESWKSFEENYLFDEAASLEDMPGQNVSPKGGRRWLRRVIGTAAVLAILIGVPLTAKALNWENIWNAVATWAKETFSFISGNPEDYSDPAPKDTNQYQSLQEAVDNGFTNPVRVPSWLPERYKLNRIIVEERPEKTTYLALYGTEDKVLKIFVQNCHSNSQKAEISEDLIEIYKVEGAAYYIFGNNEQLRAVWVQDSFECYISGELTIEEMKAMIDSIGKG